MEFPIERKSCERGKTMVYNCETCGFVAEDPNCLCDPIEMDRDFCADEKLVPTGICEDADSGAKYSCSQCGRLADEEGLLCEPSPTQ